MQAIDKRMAAEVHKTSPVNPLATPCR